MATIPGGLAKNWRTDPRFSQAVLDALPDSVAVLSREGAIVAVNRSWRRFSDESADPQSTSVGVNYLEVARQTSGPYSDAAQAAHDGIRSVLEGSLPRFTLDCPCHSPTRQRWFQMKVSKVEEMDPPTFIVMHHSIAQRKRAEMALREEEERYRSLVELSQDAILILENECIAYCNPVALTLLGCPSLEALLGRPIDAFFHPDERTQAATRRRSIIETGQATPPQPFRLTRLDGREIVVESSGARCLFKGQWAIQVVFRDITLRRQTEAALQASERRFRALIENGADGISLVTADGKVIFGTPSGTRITGFTVGEIIGKPFAELVHPDDLAAVQARFAAVIEGQNFTEPIAFRYRRKDGSWRWLQTVLTNLLHDPGVQGVVVNYRDITERVKAEAYLQQKRLCQQKAVAELRQFAFKSLHLDPLLQRCVEAVSTVLGDEFCKVLELHPDNQSLLLRVGVGWNEGLVGQATVPADRGSQAGYTLSAGEPVIVTDLRTETRFAGPPLLLDHGVVSGMSVAIQGADRPFGVLGTHTRKPVEYSPDDVYFVQCIANIIADFIERERIETRYRLLVDSIEDYAIVVLDPTGIVSTWNSGAERITGCKAEEVMGRSFSSFYTPEDVAQGKPAQELRETADTGRSCHEGWRVRKDGSRFLARCHTFAIRCEWGKLVGFARVCQDVTAQRREQVSLRSVVDHSVDVIFTIDQHGTIQSCGGPVQKMFGHKCSDLVGRNISVIMPEPLRSEHDSYLASYLRTGVAGIMGTVREVTGLRSDGSAVPLEIVVTEFHLDGGRYFTGILRDIAERKKAQDELRLQTRSAQWAAARLSAVHETFRCWNRLLLALSFQLPCL